MPSRSSQKAALRRSKEPTVIAPEGMTLPELAPPLGWRNPMHDYDFVRDVWELFVTHPGGSTILATIRQLGSGWSVMLSAPGAVGAHSVTDATAAFTLAAEYGRRVNAGT